MSIEYSTKNKDKYFLVNCSGESSELEVVSNYAREVSELCKKQGYKRMLVDERKREYRLSEVLDLYKLANFFVTLDISSIRIAIVCQPRYIDHVRFFETTVNNRGMQIKYFVDPDSAKRWLL